MPTFFQQVILTHKISQTDIVSGERSLFISRSVHARSQVSVCSGYDLCHPGLLTFRHAQTDSILASLYE